MNKGIGIRFFVLKLCGNESFWNNVVMNGGVVVPKRRFVVMKRHLINRFR